MVEPNGDGVFYRHPFERSFNNPYDKDSGTSRDQLVPIVAAMGVWGKTDAIQRLWNALPEDLLERKACQHQAEPDPAEMAARYGADTSVLDWRERLVCSKCGGRKADMVVTGSRR
jgi:hypothetical protein